VGLDIRMLVVVGNPISHSPVTSVALPEHSMSDVRAAVRSLRATPLVTAVAILSLALGIGANAAMYSIVDALVLRGPPGRHADRLTMLFDDVSKASYWSHPIWEAVRQRPGLADGAFAFSGFRFNLASGGESDPADGLFASGGMFETMGVASLRPLAAPLPRRTTSLAAGPTAPSP
jgi:putative ABC transport system permease protein